ncbi:MAG: hypothetical protein FRX49_07628 [Trebouxia sp. A1-2]|nr:MAG: hypothetical protein FRX49_07628 [Trebouxia sp. A1-2]
MVDDADLGAMILPFAGCTLATSCPCRMSAHRSIASVALQQLHIQVDLKGLGMLDALCGCQNHSQSLTSHGIVP